MIQPTASTLSASISKVAGKVHGAAGKPAESGDFSAILGDSANSSANLADAASSPTADAAALATVVAGGKHGKATGKNLPDQVEDKTGEGKSSAEAGETDITAAAAEAPAPVVMPFAIAGLLTLQPTPTSDPVSAALQSNLTDPASVALQSNLTDPASPALQSNLTNSALSGATVPDSSTKQKPLPTHPQGATARGLAESSASDRALAVHGLIPAAAAPETAASPETLQSGQASPNVPTPITTNPDVSAVDDPALAAIKLAPIEVVPNGASTTAAQLATRDARQPASSPATPAAQVAQNGIVDASAIQQAAVVTPTQLAAESDAQGQPEAGRQGPKRGADAAVETTGAKSAQPIATASTPLVVPSAPAQLAAPANDTAAVSLRPAPAIEAPQDFSTLVARLAEAREAASPQLVRTAINHAEFGQISLEFRHRDDGLAVTMASRDPGFAGTVQAAAASMANNANGGSDDSSRQQHQQRSETFQQQQATATGAGTGGGTTQNQQARADQAGQSTNRGQGTTSRPQDQEASTPRQTRDGTRNGGGIYA